ncbi:MAG: beta strand repeat-containing protein [Nitrososphaerales archaeon]
MSADDGSFSFTINVPTTLSVGSHTISASDGSKTELATFTVVTTAITLSPTSGIAGSTINVTGTGFIASASLTIKFDTLALTTTPSNLVASSSGSFSATITVPNTASSGVHTIEVSDSTGKKATATFNVLLSGKITLSPDAGNRGVSITVAGSDFNGNSEITIKFEGTTLNTTPIVVTTTPAGTFTATIKIPVTASTGEQTITATDASGRIGSSIFIVATGGLITLSPDSGLSGTEVTVTGSNFNANTRVTLKFNEITVATTPSIVMTGTDGRFSAKFDVPAGVGIGVHIVIATDDLGKIGHSSFSTESNGELITISPTSASVGSIVTITGNGFAINTDVTIKLDDTALTTNPATVVTTSGGTFTATFTVPSLAAGSHTIAVTVGTKTATASFALTQTGGPSISITPTSGTVGSSITVSGTGFAPSIGITIKLDDNVVASGTTSSSGTFNVLFSIGATVTSGPHTITASDGTKEASNTLSIISGGTNIVNISQMKLVDQSGSSLSTPSIGMHLLIQSDVKNTLSTDQQFTYVVQIKDTDGATIMISWMTGTLPPGRQYAVAQSWLVEDKGEYTAEVFVWETISNPVPLAPMQKTDFSVQ